MRFSNAQFYMLKRLASGINVTELRKWNQISLRGLWFRNLVHLDAHLNASLARKGWEAYQSCLKPKLRLDSTRPIFTRRRTDAQKWA